MLKKIIGIIKSLSISLIGIGVLLAFKALWDYQVYWSQERKITHVQLVVEADTDMMEVSEISLEICDSLYRFTMDEVRDTVDGVVGISSKAFPCEVEVVYYLLSGNMVRMEVEAFDCATCKGRSRYYLGKDLVRYEYRP